VPAVAAYFADSKGRLLALPFNTSTPVLYYNKDAFRKARLDPEHAPKTWYEMPKALGALLDTGAKCALTTTWPSWVLLENMGAWHNQPFATEDNGMEGVKARLNFNTQLMIRWVSMLASWYKAGYFSWSGRRDAAEARHADELAAEEVGLEVLDQRARAGAEHARHDGERPRRHVSHRLWHRFIRRGPARGAPRRRSQPHLRGGRRDRTGARRHGVRRRPWSGSRADRAARCRLSHGRGIASLDVMTWLEWIAADGRSSPRTGAGGGARCSSLPTHSRTTST